LGDPEAHVRSVLIALDATPAVIARLRRRPSDLLVTHHPVVFTPLKSVRPAPSPSAAAFALLRMGVAVISAHTNADAAPRGVSHAMGRRLRLHGMRPLIPGEPSSGACKIVVFVPPSHAEAVLAAAAEAGGGRIGAYTRCSFRAPGTGTFLGGPGSSPRTGTPGAEERVEEVRLETVTPGSRVRAVLARCGRCTRTRSRRSTSYRCAKESSEAGSGSSGFARAAAARPGPRCGAHRSAALLDPRRGSPTEDSGPCRGRRGKRGGVRFCGAGGRSGPLRDGGCEVPPGPGCGGGDMPVADIGHASGSDGSCRNSGV